MLSLLNDAKWTQVSNGATAAQTELDSSILDMAGYDSVIFIATLGTVTDACVLGLAAQQNSVNSTSGMAQITNGPGTVNAAATFTASGSSNTILITDVFRPIQRYVRAALTRTTQNAVVNNIIAVQYNSRSLPVTQSASVLASSFVAAQ